MLDIGWMEMAAIAAVALIIIGPKDLPKAIRMVSHWVGRARSLAREFQSGLDDIVRETELQDVKGEIEAAADLDLPGTIDGNLALPSPEDMTGETDDYLEGIAQTEKKAPAKKRTSGKSRAKAKPAGAKSARPKTTAPKTAKRSGPVARTTRPAKASAKSPAKTGSVRKPARAKTGA
ncbi:MAG: Sec-independent protein translocase protein TatB [Pseudomonadota bacterium]